MHSEIRLSFMHAGREVMPMRKVNVTDTHPGWTDVLGWQDAVSLVTATYAACTGSYKTAAAALIPLGKTLWSGKHVITTASSHETFPHGGLMIVNGQQVDLDEIGVVFGAYSDDDLLHGGRDAFGIWGQDDNASPQSILDRGQKIAQKVYTRRFSIPIDQIVAGDYVFTFGVADNGDWYDVAVASILTVTVTPVAHRVTIANRSLDGQQPVAL